jgi:fructose-bisphosphate aldolase, class I
VRCRAPALRAGRGEQVNVSAAQAAFYPRAKLNGAARTGEYRPELGEIS